MPIFNNQALKKNFQEYLLSLYQKQGKLNFQVGLIGDDFASQKYVNKKLQFGKKLGVETTIHRLPASSNQSQIQQLLSLFEQKADGALFQLPVPQSLQLQVKKLPFQLDADLMGEESQKLWNSGFLPPTVGAIDLVLKAIFRLTDSQEVSSFPCILEQKLDLSTKKVAVIGQGQLVGSPLCQYLVARQATVFSLNEHTPQIEQITRQADIIITATGQAKLVRQDWLPAKTNSGFLPILIDAGTTEYHQNLSDTVQICGDLDLEQIDHDLYWICKSPGGLGPLTVRYLFYNLHRLQKLKASSSNTQTNH